MRKDAIRNFDFVVFSLGAFSSFRMASFRREKTARLNSIIQPH